MRLRRMMWIVAVTMSVALLGSTVPVQARDTSAQLLSDPFLQLPTADSVRVVWFTEFAGQRHTLTYGTALDQTVEATSTRMSRMYEDSGSRIAGRSYSEVVDRGVWRHEAVATGLTPNVRVPYFVTSVNDAGVSVTSEQFTLQPLPTPGHGIKILLTSDQQNRLMAPANFQKVIETVGYVDAVLLAGDFVDNPHRASEWFDRYDPNWLNANPNPNRPLYPGTRPAFFPSFQGNYQEIFPEFPYTGGEILQNAYLFGTIGNHEAPGRHRPNEQIVVNGTNINVGIDHMDNDPQPRWYAELRYEQQQDAINPSGDPAIREQWIRDNSYEFTQYFEMWNHPDNGPQGESYWAYQIGDVFVISMNVSRVWRTWDIGANSRGKFREFESELNNPDEWGFGDMWFETFNQGSQQYEWLVDVLNSEAFKNAKYRVVMGHQTMFGLGDNAVPVMADPVVTIVYEEDGVRKEMSRNWPVNRTVWEAQIEPLAGKIVEVRYDYPVDQDVWKTDIEPLLLQYDVDLVHTGHSHLWNRAEIGGLNYIETSNVGNSFGAYYSDDGGSTAGRASWARSFWDELTRPDSRWNPVDYAQTNDPHARTPAFPTDFNPMFAWDGADRPVPYVNSNNVTAFTIFDTATGAVTSYAFDTRRPTSEVVKFDEFFLDPVLLLSDGEMFNTLAGAEVSGIVNIAVAPVTTIEKVVFTMETPRGLMRYVEREAPWDLRGGRGFDTRGLPNGEYSLNAEVYHNDGRIETATAEFTVQNELPELLISTSADRSAPSSLEGAVLSGNAYIFVAERDDIRRVRFWLNNPERHGRPLTVESRAPWDLMGSRRAEAQPFDTSLYPAGEHTITAEILLSSGRSVVVEGTFRIAE